MRFDLTDLRLFCDVVDAGSITAGADKSGLALAAASTRIRKMEAALGAALLSRSRQGVTPTPAGRMLLKHARAILTQQARMREDLSAYAGGLSGEVKVLANTNALTEFLPEALSSFLADHPHVSEIRQTGMILAIEMVQDKASKTAYPWQERRGLKVFQHGLERGALLRPLGSVVYFLPPYIITPEQIDFLAEVASEGIDIATRDSVSVAVSERFPEHRDPG